MTMWKQVLKNSLPNHHPRGPGNEGVERECDYCGDTLRRPAIVRLPNGLWRCPSCAPDDEEVLS